MSGRAIPLAVACLVLARPDLAVAHEYCVTCEGPPAMYRCVIEGTEDGPGTNPSVSLLCISQMAKQGRHERCGVSRGAPFPCPGLTAIIKPPAAELPTMATPPASAPQTSPIPPEAAAPPVDAAQPAEKPEDKPAKVPQTMEELAGQTVKSSQKGLEKAGEAIGGTAKKAGEHIGNAGSAIGDAATQTWTCITSLFSSCSAPQPETPPNEQAPAN
jgi:hypothetical protein